MFDVLESPLYIFHCLHYLCPQIISLLWEHALDHNYLQTIFAGIEERTLSAAETKTSYLIKEHVDKIQAKNNVLETTSTMLEEQLEIMQTKYANLMEEVQRLSENFKENQKTLTETQKRVMELEEKNADLEKRTFGLQRILEVATPKIRSLKLSREDHERRILVLEKLGRKICE